MGDFSGGLVEFTYTTNLNTVQIEGRDAAVMRAMWIGGLLPKEIARLYIKRAREEHVKTQDDQVLWQSDSKMTGSSTVAAGDVLIQGIAMPDARHDGHNDKYWMVWQMADSDQLNSSPDWRPCEVTRAGSSLDRAHVDTQAPPGDDPALLSSCGPVSNSRSKQTKPDTKYKRGSHIKVRVINKDYVVVVMMTKDHTSRHDMAERLFREGWRNLGHFPVVMKDGVVQYVDRWGWLPSGDDQDIIQQEF